jgi:hypothetical protein
MGIGVSVFLMAMGAILAFAVTVPADGIELDTVGVILIILGLAALLASLVWWDGWTPRQLVYEDDGDVIVRRRPRVVTIDDADDGVVDVVEDGPVVDLVEERPVVERRRVTTRRTSHGRF